MTQFQQNKAKIERKHVRKQHKTNEKNKETKKKIQMSRAYLSYFVERFLKDYRNQNKNSANRSNSPCWCLIEVFNTLTTLMGSHNHTSIGHP